MKSDAPTGRELQQAEDLLEADVKLKEVLEKLRVPKWENSLACFAYQGHREKGRLITILDFLRSMTDLEQEFIVFEKQVKAMRDLVGKMERLGWARFWLTLSKCRDCKGNGGSFIVPDPAPIGRDGVWTECKKCEGRGLIVIYQEQEETAEEVEAYQLKKTTQESPEWTGATNCTEAL